MHFFHMTYDKSQSGEGLKSELSELKLYVISHWIVLQNFDFDFFFCFNQKPNRHCLQRTEFNIEPYKKISKIQCIHFNSQQCMNNQLSLEIWIICIVYLHLCLSSDICDCLQCYINLVIGIVGWKFVVTFILVL